MPLRRLLASSWVPTALTAFGIVAILAAAGVEIADIGRYGLYLLGTVAFPGVVAWRMLLAGLHTRSDVPPTWFEDLSLGTIFGFGLQLPFYLGGVWTGIPLLYLALPVLALLLTVATPFGRRTAALPTGTMDVRAAWALGAVILYGLAWLARNVFVLRPLWLAPNQTPSVDETFHQALVSELMHRFPPEIPFLLGTRLDYHWFGHAQLAATTWATDIKSDVLLRQLFPAALLTLTVLGLGAVALRLSGRPVAAVIAPALLVAGGFYLMGSHYNAWVYTESYLSKRLVSSPSQAYGFTVALPAIALLLEVLRPGRRADRLTWLALVLALFALAGAKATFMPLFLCGALALWLLRLAVWRSVDRTVGALVVLLFIVTAFAQVVLFGGSSGALAFEPFDTVRGALHTQRLDDTTGAQVAMTVTLLTGWLLYGVGALGLRRAGRWSDPRALWLLFAIPPGVVVALMFFRSGLSQMWFQRSTAELVVLISAWGMGCLLPNPLRTPTALRLLAVAAAAAVTALVLSRVVPSRPHHPQVANLTEILTTAVVPVVILAVALLLYLLKRIGLLQAGSMVFVLAFVLGLGGAHVGAFAYQAVTEPVRGYGTPHNLFARGGTSAAHWLARHSATHDVVATNVHCLRPDKRRCDNRNFWVSAYTERRIVVEGWGYTADTNASAITDSINAYQPIPDPKRLAINDAAFERPSRATISRLVRSYGVRWLFVSKKYPVDLKRLSALPGVLAKKYHNDHYVVFKVRQPGG